MSGIRKVVCAVSGGVDSAVAALLLKRRGYNVVGLFMKNWDTVDEKGQCSSDKDLEDAEFVCGTLGIPLHQVNFVKQYWNQVFSEMVRDYQNGITPNPDIMCNKHIKFDVFLRHALENLGGEALATGHYARTSVEFGRELEGCIETSQRANFTESIDKGIGLRENSSAKTNPVKLLKAVDTLKDQTFFLSQISQAALQHTIFPVGGFTKDVVKTVALEAGLEKIVRKKESMGICFIGSRHFQKFIEEYVPPTPGHFVDVETGKVVSTHKGVHYWTVGQRALIAGEKRAYFVVSKDIKTQDIMVASGTDHPALYCQTFSTGSAHWIAEPPEELLTSGRAQVDFRFQHRNPLMPCMLSLGDDCSLEVTLSQPLRAITPGQYAVFYKGEECLGSARILQTGPSLFDLGHLGVQTSPCGRPAAESSI